MIDRIQQLMKTYELTAADLADTLGTERSGISHFLSGRNKPSLAFITKLLEKFPDINPDWLLLGTGTMQRSAPNQAKPKINTHAEPQIQDAVNQQNNTTPLPAKQISVAEDEEPAEYHTKRPAEKPIQAEKKQTPSPVQIPAGTEIERIVIFYNDHSFSEYKMR